MANPFLVLGGIAVGIITAAFGVLSVPGWVASAQDASARNDISSIAAIQAALVSATGQYATSAAGLDSAEGIDYTAGTARPAFVAANDTRKNWLGVVQSESGQYFARLSHTATIGSGATPAAAVTAAGTTITAGRTAEGIAVPDTFDAGFELARNYAPDPRGTNLSLYSAGSGMTVSAVTDFPGDVNTAIRSTRTSSTVNVRIIDIHLGETAPSSGQDITVRATVRLSGPMVLNAFSRRDFGQTATFNQSLGQVSLPAGVHEVVFTGTTYNATPDPGNAAIVLTSASGVLGATVDITKISVQETATAIDTFFDGDSRSVSGGNGQWLGPRNGSPSVLVG